MRWRYEPVSVDLGDVAAKAVFALQRLLDVVPDAEDLIDGQIDRVDCFIGHISTPSTTIRTMTGSSPVLITQTEIPSPAEAIGNSSHLSGALA
jgi:hypothetical protein